ncbi:uncharacterized protein F4807DRAFT_151437 [Annulohypoxylon truncatum]|uniref:uncharacterized protein n=1 Tax=Annulohypoxylon truncatum TaxID=327061 RepID=UPI0020087DE8|nr:uncharacterized protein F4807DRAFT_151437 [Annulohypoxylon truncatum]KAI1208415.1 hypothetical protein F4807DRAFT_151437 [Annulohypoxylon truncatum]
MEHNLTSKKGVALRRLERNKPVRFISNEVIDMIIRPYRLTVTKVTDATPPKDFLMNRKTLYSLCLTGSFLIKYARPLLYETVILYLDGTEDEYERVGNPRTVVLLIRTLLENPDFCPLIKNIICPSGITKDPWPSGFHRYRIESLHWPFAYFGYPA